jgi:hypothetical protein
MVATAAREAHRFIGQVIDEVGSRALKVWALDEKCAYHARPASSKDFPIGAVVECTLFDHDGFVENLHRVTDATLAEYQGKLVMPAA